MKSQMNSFQYKVNSAKTVQNQSNQSIAFFTNQSIHEPNPFSKINPSNVKNINIKSSIHAHKQTINQLKQIKNNHKSHLLLIIKLKSILINLPSSPSPSFCSIKKKQKAKWWQQPKETQKLINVVPIKTNQNISKKTTHVLALQLTGLSIKNQLLSYTKNNKSQKQLNYDWFIEPSAVSVHQTT